MKKSKFTVACACLIFLLLPVISSCTKIPEDDCLKYFAKKELQANPKLKRPGLENKVYVDKVENGYVTLSIGSMQEFFRDSTIWAIRNGESLRDIQMFKDKSVDVLVEAEEMIKKMPRVKSVSWTADEPCPVGSICSTYSGQSGYGDDEFESGCSEYKR